MESEAPEVTPVILRPSTPEKEVNRKENIMGKIAK